MQGKNFSLAEIPNRQTAIAFHKLLRETNAPLVTMGRFYMSIVQKGLWANQKAMASELGVSTAQVSRMLSAARLPEEVLAVFADKPLGFRDVATLHTLVQQLGKTEIARRAKDISFGCSVDDIFSVLTTGKKASIKGVRVSIVRGQKHLRLDVPNFEQIAPRIKELELILNAFFPSDLFDK